MIYDTGFGYEGTPADFLRIFELQKGNILAVYIRALWCDPESVTSVSLLGCLDSVLFFQV